MPIGHSRFWLMFMNMRMQVILQLDFPGDSHMKLTGMLVFRLGTYALDFGLA